MPGISISSLCRHFDLPSTIIFDNKNTFMEFYANILSFLNCCSHFRNWKHGQSRFPEGVFEPERPLWYLVRKCLWERLLLIRNQIRLMFIGTESNNFLLRLKSFSLDLNDVGDGWRHVPMKPKAWTAGSDWVQSLGKQVTRPNCRLDTITVLQCLNRTIVMVISIKNVNQLNPPFHSGF